MIDVEEAKKIAVKHGFFGTDALAEAFFLENNREPKKVNGEFVVAKYLGNYEDSYVFIDKWHEDFRLENPPMIGIPYYILVGKNTGNVSIESIAEIKKDGFNFPAS